MVGILQPLGNQFPIVGDDGKPTDYFIRWAQQRQIDIGEGITAEQALEIVVDYLEQHPLQAGANITLTPDGDINNSPTISWAADLGDLSDVDLVTVPPIDGDVLKYVAADDEWVPGIGGGGGGAGAISQIATFTATGSESTHTFSSIPSTYKDLIIHVNARSTTSATNTEVRTRFNADSGSNYAHQRLNAANTGTTATAATSQTSSFLGFIAAGTAPAGAIGFCEALVSAYTSTFNKSVFSLNPFRTSTTTSGQNDQTVMSTWIATATITSVEVFLAAGNFEAGSTITLYGRGGSNGAPDGIEIKDEGSSIDSNTSVVNFTGTVSATQTSPGEVQVDIPAVAKSGDTMTGPLTIDYAAGAQHPFDV